METIALLVCLTFYFSLRYILDFINEQGARKDYYNSNPQETEDTDDPDWWKRSNN
jgi:hypothetical protein